MPPPEGIFGSLHMGQEELNLRFHGEVTEIQEMGVRGDERVDQDVTGEGSLQNAKIKEEIWL